MAAALPLDGRSDMSQIEILGVDGKPVLYAALQDGDLRLEFEYYGHSSGEADLEIIYTIGQENRIRLIGRLFFKLSESTQLFLGCRLDTLTTILK